MSKDIRIKRGLRLKLKGVANNSLGAVPLAKRFAIKPEDFHNITPKLTVKAGDPVKVGTPIFFSKYEPSIQFVSPVSGTIAEIVRGAKRRILEVVIESDGKLAAHTSKIGDWSKFSSDEIKTTLLASGCWPFIKQRPYDVIANPNDTPKAIFVSAYSTAPLAADFEIVLSGQEEAFKSGLTVLQKLCSGEVHLGVSDASSSFLSTIEGVKTHKVSGPHPAGNVGVQIHHVAPINAGERVWTVGAEDVAIIGRYFETGAFDSTRTLALSGSSFTHPRYVKTIIGTSLTPLIEAGDLDQSYSSRLINGDVLSGQQTAQDGYLSFYNNTLTAIPEGDQYRMFGWLPFKDNHIPSLSKTSLSWLFPNKAFEVNTNLNGEERALVVTGEMEKVFPMDILPMQLIKACMAGDIEKMENLGIYEVAPEDFGPIDFACTSKIEAQSIIREGLDLMIKEVG